MVDLRLRTDSADDADDVETNGVGAVCLNVVVDGRLKTHPLLVVDSLFRVSEQPIAAGLDFHDNQRVILLGYDVKVVMARLPVAFQNLIAVILQLFGGQSFSPLA